MFGTSTVTRLGRVSVRTLRYYDEIGLLRPAWTDPGSGYRWYEPEQLGRLHRIVALRDLGVRLVEIARILDEPVSAEALRGILLLRRAEAHDRLPAAAERLARVEARLSQLEEPTMSNYDVVVKNTEAEWVVAITEAVPSLAGIGSVHATLWPRLHSVLDTMGVDRRPPSIAVERGTDPIEFTAAIPIPDGLTYVGDDDDAKTFVLPGLQRAATTVMYGDDIDEGFAALHAWIEQAGELEAGEFREVYLDCDGPRATWVVELQVALTSASKPTENGSGRGRLVDRADRSDHVLSRGDHGHQNVLRSAPEAILRHIGNGGAGGSQHMKPDAVVVGHVVVAPWRKWSSCASIATRRRWVALATCAWVPAPIVPPPVLVYRLVVSSPMATTVAMPAVEGTSTTTPATRG
ncbi:MAG: MerR family transcriptional regulator [Acidimicrobiales bacterium]